MPTSLETPYWETDKTVTPSPHHPIGAKGVGESPNVGSPAAFVNAVLDALSPLGVTHIDMPLTRDKVWQAIKDARARARRPHRTEWCTREPEVERTRTHRRRQGEDLGLHQRPGADRAVFAGSARGASRTQTRSTPSSASRSDRCAANSNSRSRWPASRRDRIEHEDQRRRPRQRRRSVGERRLLNTTSRRRSWIGTVTASMRGPIATVGGRVVDAQAQRVISTTFGNVKTRIERRDAAVGMSGTSSSASPTSNVRTPSSRSRRSLHGARRSVRIWAIGPSSLPTAAWKASSAAPVRATSFRQALRGARCSAVTPTTALHPSRIAHPNHRAKVTTSSAWSCRWAVRRRERSTSTS